MMHLKNVKNKSLDMRESLAGNLSEEYLLLLNGTAKTNVHDELNSLANEYLQGLNKRHPTSTAFQSDSLVLDDSSPWVNFMKNGEWNPIHTHSGALSCVVFLKIPPEIEAEHHTSETQMKSNTKSAGTLEFGYGERIVLSQHIYRVVPKEKEAYFFPSSLRHYVYPYTSQVERISVSANFVLS
jgi:hypothetical protein